MIDPPEGTRWKFVCPKCEGSRIRIEDADDDECNVACGICGEPLGTWGEIKRQALDASTGEKPPNAKLGFRREETKH